MRMPPKLCPMKTIARSCSCEVCEVRALKPKRIASTMSYLRQVPHPHQSLQEILCEAIDGFPESVRLPARIVAVNHNACTVAQVAWKELAQPATSRCLMLPCSFNVGPETVDGNDASIGGSVSVTTFVGKDWESSTHSTGRSLFRALGDTGSYNTSNFGRRRFVCSAARQLQIQAAVQITRIVDRVSAAGCSQL